LCDPRSGIFHGVGVEPYAVHAAIDFAAQQSGGFEHAKMFADGGKRHFEWLGQFGDFRFALRQAGQDGAASGVRERAKRGVQAGRGIVNHMV
jgi:hypothetical protein